MTRCGVVLWRRCSGLVVSRLRQGLGGGDKQVWGNVCDRDAQVWWSQGQDRAWKMGTMWMNVCPVYNKVWGGTWCYGGPRSGLIVSRQRLDLGHDDKY